MCKLSDQDLLSNIADADAVRELTRRYVSLVYSSARRQVRDAHLAEDVTQAVFILLVRKARTLRANVILPAWLHTVTRHAASNAIRMQTRRRYHESIKATMTRETDKSQATAGEVEPLLDEAMARLSDAERSGVLLHFFNSRTHSQVGESLGVSEDAARKRISRALDKMRVFLEGRGVIASGAALATLLIGESASASVPSSLAASVSNVAVLANTASANSAASLIAEGVGRMLVISKIKVAATIAACVMLGGAASVPIIRAASSLPLVTVPHSVVTYVNHTGDPEPSTAPAASTIEISKNLRIHLLGIAPFNGGPGSWCSISGEPIEMPAGVPDQLNIMANPPPEHLLAIKLDSTDDEALVSVHVPGAGMVANCKVNSDSDKMCFTAFTLERGGKEATVEISVASDPWKTVATNDKLHEGGDFDAGDFGGINFSPIGEDSSQTMVVVSYPFNPTPCHVVAVDAAGAEHSPTNVNVNQNNDQCDTTFKFDIPKEKVAKLLFQVREYNKRVEVKGISLEPGHITKPQITVNDVKKKK